MRLLRPPTSQSHSISANSHSARWLSARCMVFCVVAKRSRHGDSTTYVPCRMPCPPRTMPCPLSRMPVTKMGVPQCRKPCLPSRKAWPPCRKGRLPCRKPCPPSTLPCPQSGMPHLKMPCLNWPQYPTALLKVSKVQRIWELFFEGVQSIACFVHWRQCCVHHRDFRDNNISILEEAIFGEFYFLEKLWVALLNSQKEYIVLLSRPASCQRPCVLPIFACCPNQNCDPTIPTFGCQYSDAKYLLVLVVHYFLIQFVWTKLYKYISTFLVVVVVVFDRAIKVFHASFYLNRVI